MRALNPDVLLRLRLVPPRVRLVMIVLNDYSRFEINQEFIVYNLITCDCETSTALCQSQGNWFDGACNIFVRKHICHTRRLGSLPRVYPDKIGLQANLVSGPSRVH